MVRMHKRLSAATGGESKVPPTWTILINMVTPHPLGGCNMGTTQHIDSRLWEDPFAVLSRHDPDEAAAETKMKGAAPSEIESLCKSIKAMKPSPDSYC